MQSPLCEKFDYGTRNSLAIDVRHLQSKGGISLYHVTRVYRHYQLFPELVLMVWQYHPDASLYWSL